MSSLSIHPEMQVIRVARQRAIDQFGPPGESPESQRRWWIAYCKLLAQPAPADMRINDYVVQGLDHAVPVRVYQPSGYTGPRPCIVYMRGGGFVVGDLDTSNCIAWGYAQQTGATVVSVDYRSTPEHPYPAAFNDCYTVLTWLANGPDEVEVDPNRIAVTGDSAGGSLAAALCLAARDRDGPKVAAQALIYPMTGLDPTYPSYIEHAGAEALTTEAMIRFNELYLPGNTDTDDPYARPVQATDHSNLPPTFIHTAGIDSIRDDGRVYASKLALAGTWVTYREARGMIHGFMRARFTGEEAKAEYDVLCAFFSTHLGSEYR